MALRGVFDNVTPSTVNPLVGRTYRAMLFTTSQTVTIKGLRVSVPQGSAPATLTLAQASAGSTTAFPTQLQAVVAQVIGNAPAVVDTPLLQPYPVISPGNTYCVSHYGTGTAAMNIYEDANWFTGKMSPFGVGPVTTAGAIYGNQVHSTGASVVATTSNFWVEPLFDVVSVPPWPAIWNFKLIQMGGVFDNTTVLFTENVTIRASDWNNVTTDYQSSDGWPTLTQKRNGTVVGSWLWPTYSMSGTMAPDQLPDITIQAGDTLSVPDWMDWNFFQYGGYSFSVTLPEPVPTAAPAAAAMAMVVG